MTRCCEATTRKGTPTMLTPEGVTLFENLAEDGTELDFNWDHERKHPWILFNELTFISVEEGFYLCIYCPGQKPPVFKQQFKTRLAACLAAEYLLRDAINNPSRDDKQGDDR